MFNVFTSISWISVILAFFSYFFLGALWYMFLFPKSYRKSLGRDPEVDTTGSAIFIVGPAVCALVITITCAILMYALSIDSFSDVVQFTLLIGIGFLFTNTVNIAINPNMPKPFSYGLITGMYHLIGMVLVNSILFVFMI